MSASPRRHAPLTAVLALAALAGCRAVDVHGYNLDQLHASSGQHHFSAALEGNIEYWFRHVIAPALGGANGYMTKKAPKSVKDPAETCLEQLLELEELDISDRYNRARVIQWSSRLAVDDSSLLSRERALFVLAKAAAPLGHILPLPAPKDRPLADPDAVSSALASLVGAAKPLLGSGEWDATAEADFGAALELVRGLNLDLDGARRSLEVCCSVAARAGWDGRGREIAKLVTELERTCVGRAIARGLADDAPRTQAAAIEASEAVAGRGVLAGLLHQAASQEHTPSIVVERILEGLRAGGLVREVSEPGAPPPERLVEQQFEDLMRIAIFRDESELRVAAMCTLAAVSGSGISSLREEDWQGWWNLRTAALAKGGPKP